VIEVCSGIDDIVKLLAVISLGKRTYGSQRVYDSKLDTGELTVPEPWCEWDVSLEELEFALDPTRRAPRTTIFSNKKP